MIDQLARWAGKSEFRSRIVVGLIYGVSIIAALLLVLFVGYALLGETGRAWIFS